MKLGDVVPYGSARKCLGYWWSGDLGATRAVEENIAKAGKLSFIWEALEFFRGT